MSSRNFHLKVNADIALKSLTKQNAAELYKHIEKSRSTLEVYMNWASACTLESLAAHIQSMRYQSIYDDHFDLGIFYRGRIVGVLGFNSGQKFKQSVDLGYWISNEYAQIGIVSKACKALINFAFELTEVQQIFIKTEITNKRSFAIAQKLGFEFVSQEKGGCYFKNGEAEMVTYVLSKKF